MKISQTLYVRVALSIAVVAMLVSMVISVLSYFSSLDSRQAANYLLIEQLAKTVEKTAAIAAYVNDAELSQEIVSGLLSNDLVKGVSLYAEQGLLQQQGITEQTHEKISLSLKHPFVEDTIIGSLTLYPDDTFIQSQVIDATGKEAFLMFLHSIFIALFVSLVVNRQLTRPLRKLTASFAEVDPSSPQTMRMLKQHKGGDNEISRLITGINSLMHELHATISNERNLREKTQQLESRFRLIFEQASAGICLLDDNNAIIMHNPAFASYFGSAGRKNFSADDFPQLLNNVEKLQDLLREIRSNEALSQITLDLQYRNGNHIRWLHCLFAKLTDQRDLQRDEQGCLVEVIMHDVTERAEREFQTRFEADHDPLTHLLNRRAGEKRLHKALFDSLKNQQHLILMMIDLDKFKPVNDTFGHEAGDIVLVEVARRIKQRFCLSSDICIRWGGDEFVVARQLVHFDRQLSRQQAEEMLNDILKPIHISEYEQCAIGASIGMVVAPEHGKVLHELMVNADNTMYQVKEAGRGQVAYFNPGSLPGP